jgi:hypothetical protein
MCHFVFLSTVPDKKNSPAKNDRQDIGLVFPLLNRLNYTRCAMGLALEKTLA